jgi:hypothetical protein
MHISPTIILLLCMWACPGMLPAQIPDGDPAHLYRLEARLDTEQSVLEARGELHYTNAGAEGLDRIYLHLWANAFSDNKTAWSRQALQMRETKVYFAKKEDRIRYTDFSVAQGGSELSWTYWQGHPDVVELTLPKPLAPGATLVLEMNWSIAYPTGVSRMGSDGVIWQMAHWYPKAARYDHEGWHPMPYLDLGEWFQDFARYEVTLDLPAGMTMISTGLPGDAATAGHRQLALDRSKEGDAGLPEVADGRRTWRLEADWVTDFAWAASQEFLFFADTITLPSGGQTIAQVAYRKARMKQWASALEYVRRSVSFYDEQVGPYPWPVVGAVEGYRGFTGGMEYPMLTFIQPGASGNTLELVIAHEVGHNWFYGILATDERRFPWMDEGLNSYYEQKYSERYGLSEMEIFGIDPIWLATVDRANRRQAPRINGQAPDWQGGLQYQLGAYSLPANLLTLLAHEVGEDRLDRAIRHYFDQWKFDHPYPADLRRSLEESLAVDLGWVFEQALERPFYRDLRLSRVAADPDSLTLRVHSKWIPGAPYQLSLWGKDALLQSEWVSGFSGGDTLIRVPRLPGLRRVSVLDTLIPDLRTGNNTYRLAWPHRYHDWRPGFLYGFRSGQAPRTYLTPLVGNNTHDGYQLGLGMHNQKAIYQPAGFYVGALYGIESQRWNYHAALYHDVYPGEGPSRIRVGGRLASFHFFTRLSEDLPGDRRLRYQRWMPYVEWHSDPGAMAGTPYWEAGLYSWFVRRDRFDFGAGDPPGPVASIVRDWDRIYALRASRRSDHLIESWMLAADIEFQSYRSILSDQLQSYLKLGLEGQYSYMYMKGRRIHGRFYAGYFAHNTRREAGSVSNPETRGSFNLAFQGHNDYRFEETFMGRNTFDGLAGRQVMLRDGGFKTALGPAFADGQSNDMILAINLWAGLPVKAWFLQPVQLYTDLGYFADRQPIGRDRPLGEQLWWDLGIKLSLPGDALAFYFPMVQNKTLGDLLHQRGGSYWNRVSWSARFEFGRLPNDVLSFIPL